MGQLAQWAQAADIVEQAAQKQATKPPIFKKLSFGDDTKQAFDAYTAQVKLREMEADIRHEFLYGGLCHLGLDGFREFIQLRRQIRERRIRMLQEQQERRKAFIETTINVLLWSGLFIVVVLIIWGAIEIILLGVK